MRKLPERWSRKTRMFYREMTTKYPYLEETGWVEQLVAACDAKQTYENAQKILDDEGITQVTRSGLKVRPEVSVANQHLSLFSRLMARLELKVPKVKVEAKTRARKR